MAKFEYKVQIIKYDYWDEIELPHLLNKLGKAGWRLIQVVDTFFFFEREILDNKGEND